MNPREPAESEEVRFEDIDLVYIFPFDLGAPVEAGDLKKLLEWFSERCKIVEGIWIPPEEAWPTPEFVYRKAKELGIDVEKIGIEELMKNKKLKEEVTRAHAMFGAIISADEQVFDPEYLELGRFVRVKLTDLNMSIKDKELGYLNELKCELYLLLHRAGVGVLTAWIHLNGNFSTDDLINIEKKLYKAECTIKGSFGSIEGTLRGFIVQGIIRPLQAAVLFKGEYGGYDKAFYVLKRGDITGDKIDEKLRTPYFPVFRVMYIRKHRCNYKCETAEEAVRRHLRELAGISEIHGNWRHYREDVARKDLGENLSPDVHYAMFVTTGVTSLFLGSATLDEELKSEEDKELVYRGVEFVLVQPVEFLSLSDMILRAYTSVCRSKFEEIRERRKRGETVKPSEIAKIREGLMEGLEEYNNVSLFIEDPRRSIMEHGKERLRLSDRVDMLKSLLEELDDMARTLYEEEISRKQTILTAYFGVFGALGSLLLLPQPFNVAVTVAFLSYPIYEFLSFLYRRVKG
jgi:hypothetical protein